MSRLDDAFHTRCPYCQTLFRVRPEQLAIAEGRVRCGQCFGVFLAEQHRAVSAPTRASVLPAALPAGVFNELGEDYHGDEVRALDGSVFPAQGQRVSASVSLPPRPEPKAEGADWAHAPSSYELPARSVALDATPDEPESPQDEAPEPDATPAWLPDERAGELCAVDEDEAFGFVAPEPALAPRHQEPWRADEPAAGSEPWPGRREPAWSAMPDVAVEEAELAQAEWPAENAADAWPGMDEPGPDLAEASEDGHETAPDEAAATEAEDSPEPEPAAPDWQELSEAELEAALEREPESPLRLFAWGLGSLALLALLAFQGFWGYKDPLAQNREWRPWVEQGCALLGCTLQPLRDVGRIQLGSSALKPNPALAGAFDVHLMLLNRAPHAQPYPDIELTFTNLDGKRLATRRFRPREYLAPEILGQSMPAGTPVHVRFAILAPDPSATGFEFRFH